MPSEPVRTLLVYAYGKLPDPGHQYFFISLFLSIPCLVSLKLCMNLSSVPVGYNPASTHAAKSGFYKLVGNATIFKTIPDRRPAECGLAGRVGSAGVCVLRLLPDQRPAECGLAGRVGSAGVCVLWLLPYRRPAESCGSSLTCLPQSGQTCMLC